MPKRHLVNAKFAEMRHPFQTVTVPTVQAAYLRDYLIRYVAVTQVDNQGEPCEKCALRGAIVECNLYAYDWEGKQLEAECCTECVFTMLDEVWDTDPSRVVLVERIPSHTIRKLEAGR